MSLHDDLMAGLKTALKAADTRRVNTIRMLLAELKNEQMQAGKKADDVTVVKRYAKKLTKALEEYERLGVADRAAELRAELAIVEEFLPQPLSDEQLEQLIDAILAEHNITSPRQIGQAMGILMKEHRDRVDGAKAQQILKTKLAGG